MNSRASTPFTQVRLLWKEDMGLGGVGRLTELPGHQWAEGCRAQLGLYSVYGSSVIDFSNVSIGKNTHTHTQAHWQARV